MKLPIFLSVAIVLLSACVPEERTPASVKSAPVRPELQPVDLTSQSDRDLQSLGFILPSQSVKAPNFSLRDLSGNVRSLRSYRGKLVLLNFWGVWCYYCRLEMPSLQRLYDRLKAAGLEIVAVDVRDKPDTARDFIKKNKYTFPVLLDEKLTVTEAYGIGSFPTTFIVDKEGNLRAMAIGAVKWDNPALAAVFNKILDRENESEPAPGGKGE